MRSVCMLVMVPNERMHMWTVSVTTHTQHTQTHPPPTHTLAAHVAHDTSCIVMESNWALFTFALHSQAGALRWTFVRMFLLCAPSAGKLWLVGGNYAWDGNDASRRMAYGNTGGFHGCDNWNGFYSYDPSTAKWTAMRNLPHARCGNKAVYIVHCSSVQFAVCVNKPRGTIRESARTRGDAAAWSSKVHLTLL